MFQTLKIEIKNYLEEYYKNTYNQDIQIIIEQPKNLQLGDLSIPVFNIVKILHKPLPECIKEVKDLLLNEFSIIKEVNPTGGFLNLIIIKSNLAQKVLEEIIEQNHNYGNNRLGEGKTVVIDYSAPNIAKSFSIGHLRSTMIGNSLKYIYQKNGYKVISINYLGDWGTQFGKMIVAFKLWGNKEKIMADPINELTKLYVYFHDMAKENESLNEMARAAFLKLEQGDNEYLELWRWIREESLHESTQLYELLKVEFDSYRGEAYYNDKMDKTVKLLEEHQLLVKDEGAMIVNLGDDIPPALIKRTDGGSLYITRDLTAVLDRYETYKFDKCLYVVGNEQKLHFTQLGRILEKLDSPLSSKIKHINFGLVLQNGKKMSTRGGGVVKLYDVLKKTMEMAYEQICQKNPDLDNKETIAKKVGIGAVVFNDLKNHRTLDYEFDLEKMLKFEGQTGPYLQYTIVRINSILNENSFDITKIDKSLFEIEHYFELIRLAGEFNEIIIKSAEEDAPSIIAKYLLTLAQSFNKFYALEKINHEVEAIRETNLALASSIRIILTEGLRLLGITTVERM